MSVPAEKFDCCLKLGSQSSRWLFEVAGSDFLPKCTVSGLGVEHSQGCGSFIAFATLRILAVTNSPFGGTVRCEDSCGHFAAHTSNTCCTTSPADPLCADRDHELMDALRSATFRGCVGAGSSGVPVA